MRSPARASLAAIALLGVAYAVVSRVVFRGFPFSGDEYSIFLQSEIFALGRLSVPAPPHAALFSFDHVLTLGRIRSKYPPGTAALLTPGMLAGVPWLVMPLSGVVTLALMRHTTAFLFNHRAALATVVVLGVSPMFVFEASTFYSHAPLVMWLALALAATARFSREERLLWPAIAGGAVGCAFLTRPIDAVVFAVPLTVFGLRSAKAIACAAAAGLPAVALMLLYQRAQFGGALVDGYAAYAPEFRAIYGAITAQAPLRWHHVVDVEQLSHHLLSIKALALDWAFPGAVVLFVVGAVSVGRAGPHLRPFRNLAVAWLLVAMVAFFAMISFDDDGPLPRYLSPLLVPLAFLAGPGWIALADGVGSVVGARAVRGLAVLGIALGMGAFAQNLDKRLPLLWTREGLYREVDAQGLHDAVVVVRAEYPTRYTRSGPGYDGPVLYVRPGLATLSELASWFPGRTIYEAIEGRPWSLHAMAPAP
jgi:4-amino-4-deoxy-L-arabinose transferase-like glycosyltransferase